MFIAEMTLYVPVFRVLLESTQNYQVQLDRVTVTSI
jgi:hypothetical protein